MEDGPSTHTPVILLLARERGRAPRQGASIGRRRLPDQAVPPGRTDGPDAQPAGAIRAGRFAPLPTRGRHCGRGLRRPRNGGPARVILFYGAKGGVGTTTIAINTAIALHKELGRRVCLIDANLQFGDHRVFMDLGLDKMSVVDLATSPGFDLDLIRQILIKHESGVDLLLAPPSPETAELVTSDHLPEIINHDGERVRLHRPRRGQAPRRGEPADHGRGPDHLSSS